MATVVVKKLEDFKTIVNNAGLIVFWMIDPETNDLLLYASSESVYCIRLTINQPENLLFWLEANFTSLMEVKDVF